MNNNWNIEKLERQATGNQPFDEYILNETGILNYTNLKVLDIGCSNGFKTEMLFDKYNNISKITGIDIDENAIKEAKLKFEGNARYRFELKSIDDLNKKNQYDIIYLSYVLQHIQNPQGALNKIRELLTERGIIIIKVPDDSFKFCYPDGQELLSKIFELYEKEIMPKQNVTRYTDRYVGKKVYHYLKNSGYTDIQLSYSIKDTVGKTLEERLKLFDSSIGFRSAIGKENITNMVKLQMENSLKELRKEFENPSFYYTMSVLYYTARK